MPTEPDSYERISLRVQKVLAAELSLPGDEVDLELGLDDRRLRIDSLRLIRLNIALEEEFDVVMPDLATPARRELRSVRDLVDFIAEQTGAGPAEGGAR